MTEDAHSYRAEPEREFADRLEGDLLGRLALEPVDVSVHALDRLRGPETEVLDLMGTNDERRRPRRRVLIGIAAAAVFVVVAVVVASVFVSGGGEHAPVVTPAGPSPSSTTDLAPPASQRLNVFPAEGAIPSEPETGVLVANLPPLPLFVYEDRRVIVSQWTDDGGWKNWSERRLTPEGLELVRAEIRAGGHLDSAVPLPRLPVWGWFDGDRELITNGVDPDLSWLPASAWEDPEPKLFVPSKYLVCLRETGDRRVDPSALVALLPRDAAEPFAGASQSDAGCFDLTTDNAREVAAALDAAGAGQPGHGNPFSYGIETPGEPSMSVEILLTAYLPHGNPVFCCAG